MKYGKNKMAGGSMRIRVGRKNFQIRVIPILLMLYSALISLENVLAASFGGSINKYIGLLIMGFTAFWFFSKKKTTVILPIWMFLFSAYAFCSMLWSVDRNISTLSVMLNVVLFTFIAMQYPLTKSEKEGLIVAIFLGGVIVSFLMLSGGDFATINTIDRDRMSVTIGGLTADNNNLAASLSLCCISGVSLIYRKKRGIVTNIAVLIGLAVITIAILKTGSRGGLLTLIVGGTIFLLFSDNGIKPRTLVIGAVCVYAAMYFIGNYMSVDLASRFTLAEVISSGGTGRTTIWLNALKLFAKSPIWRWFVGYGFGSFPYIMNSYTGSATAAHNDIIQMLLETGVIGLFLYFRMWWEMARKALARKNATVIALLAVVAVGSLSMEMLIKKMLWLAFYIAIVNALKFKEKTDVGSLRNNQIA